MPTLLENLKDEVEKARQKKVLKEIEYQRKLKEASNANEELEKSRVKYDEALKKSKDSETWEKAKRLSKQAEDITNDSTISEDQRDIKMIAIKKELKEVQKDIGEGPKAASENLESSKRVAKGLQEDLSVAQTGANEANTEYNDKKKAVEDENQRISDAKKQAENKVIDVSAMPTENEIAEFKKSGTGLSKYSPDSDCKNNKADCSMCNPYLSSAQLACTEYFDADKAYIEAQNNTDRVAEQERVNKENITAALNNVQNKAAGYNKSISAGGKLLDDMAKDGSTQAQRDRLVRNLEESRSLVSSFEKDISEIKSEFGNSDKRIADAKDTQGKAQVYKKQKYDAAKIAIAELAVCNLKCKKSLIPVISETSKETGKSQSSTEGVGGAIGLTGPVGPFGAVLEPAVAEPTVLGPAILEPSGASMEGVRYYLCGGNICMYANSTSSNQTTIPLR